MIITLLSPNIETIDNKNTSIASIINIHTNYDHLVNAVLTRGNVMSHTFL